MRTPLSSTSVAGATAAQVPRAVQRFLALEAAGSILLLAGTVVALVWANSPASGAYEDLWATELSVTIGGAGITEDLRHWVNDGLMVFFFYVVGLEIRRELEMGELTDRRAAALPAAAALGGMLAPVALYLALNVGGDGARGWGIVMATDIAFVLGALAVLGSRCPPALRAFLLTLAIVDDIGAILIIALVYTSDLNLVALGIGGGFLGVLVAIRHARAWRGPALFVAGLALWVALHESGVHPTIAGVVLGLLTAVHPPRRAGVERAISRARALRQAPTPASARSAMLEVGDAVSPNERLQEALHPLTSFVVVPIFALANAGVALDGDALSAAATSPITLGVVLALVVGKLAGVSLASLGALRSGLGTLPEGVRRGHLTGAAGLAGIGFTVSLFIVDLAFTDPALREEAKVGVLAASLLALIVGGLILRGVRDDAPAPLGRALTLHPPVDPAVDHVRGAADAPLTLVEFVDLECLFCNRAAGTVAELRERFGPRLRYVLRHAPVTALHPHAETAALATEAAAAQGRFWPFTDRIAAAPDRLELDDLLGHAQAVGLDVERFMEHLQEDVHAPRVESDLRSARLSGVLGTPTFFVNGLRHEGAHEVDALAAALEASAGAT